MDATRKRNMIIGVAGGLVVIVVLWLMMAGGGESLRDVSGDSQDAREAMEVLTAIAMDPKSVPDHMVSDVARGVLTTVTETAEQMAKGRGIELESAGWWRGFMRVQVSWTSAAGEPLNRTFFLQKEGGRLCIRGLQL